MLLIVHGDISPQLEEGEGPRYGFGTEVFTYEEDHGEVAFRFWRLQSQLFDEIDGSLVAEKCVEPLNLGHHYGAGFE